ncbi:Hypothetical predicted protein [Paramuricea clavata]|uniref:Uncharacterized protein n=1 Tax=Paramuricea clavata TaxID=317549 RepID=A0A7D9HTK1_PARCT|nr:Hypothetical predicted protein [Paramuricea clavata]
MANDELMMDFQKLKENIRTFSNGEARIIDFDTKEPSKHIKLNSIKAEHLYFNFPLGLPTQLEIKRWYF